MGKRRKVLEGWLYGCGMEECLGAFLFKRRLTKDDFAEEIENTEREIREGRALPWARCELEKLKRALREGGEYLYCLIAPLCFSKFDDLRLADVVGELKEFFGKKVRITIEEVE